MNKNNKIFYGNRPQFPSRINSGVPLWRFLWTEYYRDKKSPLGGTVWPIERLKKIPSDIKIWVELLLNNPRLFEWLKKHDKRLQNYKQCLGCGSAYDLTEEFSECPLCGCKKFVQCTDYKRTIEYEETKDKEMSNL